MAENIRSESFPVCPLDIPSLQKVLVDQSNPMSLRFRAIFTLRNHETVEAIDALNSAFSDPSALLKHELAYVMGQMQHPHAIPYLIKVLSNPDEDCMVRHEAGEALGALGDAEILPVLQQFVDDPAIEVAETCRLAVDYVHWKIKNQQKVKPLSHSPFESVDPAPTFTTPRSVAKLREKLLDTSLPLFKRYRAMFALRNENTEEAVLALAAGFEDSSALFRHEIAYVLGQMQHKAAVTALDKILRKSAEHKMVRHEAAEAIGAIAVPHTIETLAHYAKDPEPAVSESCEVALDMIDYYSSDQLNYTL